MQGATDPEFCLFVSPSPAGYTTCCLVNFGGPAKRLSSMLSEIDPRDYIQIKASAHERILQHPLINAVLSGIQAGSVYADSSRDSFLVSTKSGFSLYSASGQQERFDEEFFDFLRNNNDIPDYVHIYSPASSFLEYLSAHWSKYKIRGRAQFRYFGT